MTVRKLGVISSPIVLAITNHLKEQQEHLVPDKSNYAKGRLKYWLQHEWSLNRKVFIPGIKDERLWTYCKHWMPDADLGLVIYGPVGITPHRDDSYADWRGVAINLGEIKSWSYDCQYPEYRWTKNRNRSNPQAYSIPVGGVFEFNTKNLHGVNQPAPNRWAIFLWKVSAKLKSQFITDIKRNTR